MLLGTTPWLAEERVAGPVSSPLGCVLEAVADRYQVPLVGAFSRLRFSRSRHQQLRDFEAGYVKEGVGAGALLLLAQLQGASTDDLLIRCDRAMEALLISSVTSSP